MRFTVAGSPNRTADRPNMPIRVCRLALAMFLTLILAVATSCGVKEQSKFEYYRITIDGQQTLGVSEKDTLVRAVVIFFHGVGGSEFSITDAAHIQLTTDLVDAGFAVFASSAGGDAWGSPASQHNYLYMGGTAADHYSTENVFFVAESMGAIAAANLLAEGYSLRVKGFAAINPILDLASVQPQYQPAVEKIYPNQSFAAHNPVTLPVDTYKKLKMRFYVSPDDQSAPPGPNALAFKKRFGATNDISIVDCAGPAGDPSCMQGTDIVKWFSQLEERTAS